MFCKPNLAKTGARERRGGESAPALYSNWVKSYPWNMKHVLDMMSQTHFRKRSGVQRFAGCLPSPVLAMVRFT